MQTTQRAASAPRAPRKPQLIGCRVPGFRSDWADVSIYGSTRTYGELGLASWYRMRANDGRCKEHWRIGVEVCGKHAHFDAVVDDFGDLVAVQAH